MTPQQTEHTLATLATSIQTLDPICKWQDEAKSGPLALIREARRLLNDAHVDLETEAAEPACCVFKDQDTGDIWAWIGTPEAEAQP